MNDKGADEDALPKTKKEPQAFHGLINYLYKFSPSISGICESLGKLASATVDLECSIPYNMLQGRYLYL